MRLRELLSEPCLLNECKEVGGDLVRDARRQTHSPLRRMAVVACLELAQGVRDAL